MSNGLEAKILLYSIFSCEHEMCELHTVASQVFHHQTENKHKLSHLAIQTETVWLCFYFQIKRLLLFHFQGFYPNSFIFVSLYHVFILRFGLNMISNCVDFALVEEFWKNSLVILLSIGPLVAHY